MALYADRMIVRKVDPNPSEEKLKDVNSRKRLFHVSQSETEGLVYMDPFTADWERFLNGHWTKQKPTAPGRYPIATRHGEVVGEVLFYRDGRGGVFSTTHQDWKGWWWSTSRPSYLPISPPEWKEELPKLHLVKEEIHESA